jgi:hypothetical protein
MSDCATFLSNEIELKEEDKKRLKKVMQKPLFSCLFAVHGSSFALTIEGRNERVKQSIMNL